MLGLFSLQAMAGHPDVQSKCPERVSREDVQKGCPKRMSREDVQRGCPENVLFSLYISSLFWKTIMICHNLREMPTIMHRTVWTL